MEVLLELFNKFLSAFLELTTTLKFLIPFWSALFIKVKLVSPLFKLLNFFS